MRLRGEDVLICGCGFLRERDRRDEPQGKDATTVHFPCGTAVMTFYQRFKDTREKGMQHMYPEEDVW